MNLAPALALAVVLAYCAGAGNHCANPPAGSVNAFFAGGEASRDLTASVSALTALSQGRGFRYGLSDGSTLTWMAKEPIPGLETGRGYRFVVDYAPGNPDASGVLLFDGDRLLFAALTDQRPFQRVLKGGVPGFAIAAGDAACGSRARTKCHEALVNLPLSFEHAGKSAVLHQGEHGRVGEFEIEVLTAQKVTYSPRCADAGLPGVSFVIHRAM